MHGRSLEMSIRAATLLFIAFWLVLGLYFAFEGMRLGLGRFSSPGAGFMPFAIGIVLIGFLHRIRPAGIDAASEDRSRTTGSVPFCRCGHRRRFADRLCARSGADRFHRQHRHSGGVPGASRRRNRSAQGIVVRPRRGVFLSCGFQRSARGSAAMNPFESLLFGFGVALEPHNLVFCLVGCVVGTLIGVLPGIGPAGALAMLLPVTISMPPVTAVIMLAGIYYGAMYGGSTTAILINIPGEAASIVTTIEGNRMAQQGRAGPALAIAAIASFAAGTIAVFGLMLVAPPLAPVRARLPVAGIRRPRDSGAYLSQLRLARLDRARHDDGGGGIAARHHRQRSRGRRRSLHVRMERARRRLRPGADRGRPVRSFRGPPQPLPAGQRPQGHGPHRQPVAVARRRCAQCHADRAREWHRFHDRPVARRQCDHCGDPVLCRRAASIEDAGALRQWRHRGRCRTGGCQQRRVGQLFRSGADLGRSDQCDHGVAARGADDPRRVAGTAADQPQSGAVLGHDREHAPRQCDAADSQFARWSASGCACCGCRTTICFP